MNMMLSNIFVRPVDVTCRLVVPRLVFQMLVPLDKVVQEKDDLRSLNLPAMNETLFPVATRLRLLNIKPRISSCNWLHYNRR